jgi:uncharacterized protein (DUF4415 family)
MNENTKPASAPWTDPDDDYVEWTEEMFRAAAIYKGGKLVRPATGKLGPNGILPLGRPRAVNPKKAVSLRLDPDVIEKFRATGKGWQSRINAALREKLGI